MKLIVRGTPRNLIGYTQKPLFVTAWALRKLSELPDGVVVFTTADGRLLDPAKNRDQNGVGASEPIYINLTPGEAA